MRYNEGKIKIIYNNNQMNVITKTVSLPDGRTISIETGKLAKQADGAVMLRMNNTMLLATVVLPRRLSPAQTSCPSSATTKKNIAPQAFPRRFH